MVVPAYVWFILLSIVLCTLLFAFPRESPATPSMAVYASPSPPPTVSKENRGPTKVFDLNNESEADAFSDGILMVYAPWCGHCKNMMPAYDMASTQSKVQFARLEGSKAPGFMQKHEIRGFPTILSVKDKVISRYSGGRDTASLLAHASSFA